MAWILERVEDMCHSCGYFDYGNYECKKGNYLDGGSDKFTVACDDYIDKDSDYFRLCINSNKDVDTGHYL